MNYTSQQSQAESTLRSAFVYLIAHGKGMSYAEDHQGGNDLNLKDLSQLIAEMKKDRILQDNGKYIQQTLDLLPTHNHETGEFLKNSKLIIFDTSDQIIEVISFEELFALRDELDNRYGIKKCGFKRLIQSLL
ncbi:hypothetical protein ASD24_24925 [Paenibacillus sp. Root52]|uniref:hypothetical protein n=1 Tax=Paenibacillus sp. Root52 TaxID=1736552 RepID=UPI0006F77E8D|nr:hypothetical protein [Paenibacillus sp. Root52]KQY91043.1 hypothetical protein ASD24_24925 [Paenibacillus sp. Root52]